MRKQVVYQFCQTLNWSRHTVRPIKIIEVQPVEQQSKCNAIVVFYNSKRVFQNSIALLSKYLSRWFFSSKFLTPLCFNWKKLCFKIKGIGHLISRIPIHWDKSSKFFNLCILFFNLIYLLYLVSSLFFLLILYSNFVFIIRTNVELGFIVSMVRTRNPSLCMHPRAMHMQS